MAGELTYQYKGQKSIPSIVDQTFMLSKRHLFSCLHCLNGYHEMVIIQFHDQTIFVEKQSSMAQHVFYAERHTLKLWYQITVKEMVKRYR